MRLPGQPFGYLLGLLLAVACVLALGALVCAVSRTTKIAAAIGSAVFFLMMFTAGVWVPVQVMPDVLRHIVQVTPFGAASQVLDRAATGAWPSWAYLGVVALWTVLAAAGAIRTFRWE